MLTPFQSRAGRALANTPLFGELGSESLAYIHRAAVRKGDLLYEKGEPSGHVYALISGRMKVFSSPTSGREIALELIAPGELLGELGVMDGGPRYASVRALVHTELAAISGNMLDALFDERPELRSHLVRSAAETASRLAQRAEDVAFLTIETRLEKVLADLAERFGEAVEHGVRIRLRQQELADVLGVSRESISRALSAPGLRAGLEVGRGSIVLLGG